MHLGQEDLAPADARAIMPAESIIGFSTHNQQQLREGDSQPVDYLAIGPIFATRSKQNPDPVVGVEALRALRAETGNRWSPSEASLARQRCAGLEAGADSLAVIGDLYPEALTTSALRQRAEEWLAICSSSS